MNLEDILYTCERISGILFIPIRVYDLNSCTGTFGFGEMLIDPAMPFLEDLLHMGKNVGLFITPLNQKYGVITHGKYAVILGPIGRIDGTSQEKTDYASELGVSQKDFERLSKQMTAIPNFSAPHFLHILLVTNFIVNREKLSFEDVFSYIQTSDISEPPNNVTLTEQESLESKEYLPIHNQMSFERKMLAYVRIGDVQGLKRFFNSQTHGSSGMMAGDRVRHLKNFFIMAVTLVSRAAMDGGLFEDEALRLSEEYVIECEKLSKPELIIELMNFMVTDYTQRVSEIENTEKLSPLTSAAISFIKKNISSSLDVQSLANRFYVNRKTLSSKFKTEMGKTLTKYISDERLNRAESLLIHTDKTLAEISDYLGYASQSHFQTRFKTKNNKTPTEFRRENRF